MTTETLNFSADVSRLLDIVAHALYSNRDVFLRELISNAADACDRLRYEALTHPGLIKGDPDFKIRVAKDTETRTVTVSDNGIGMNREELVDNLGTIAKSGTAALMDQVRSSGNDKEKLSLIGQFGVGFYASFMVANKVSVVSRKAGEPETWLWESDGRTGFSIREATGEESKNISDGRGTFITLHINDDSSEFLIDEKLKQVIQTWSDHIGFPIFIDSISEPINRAAALWTRPKSEITGEEYKTFYRHIGHGADEPLMTSHWKAEGKIEYTALLFTPTLRPWDLYDPTRRHSVRLYVKRVFITDDCEGLMYPWLRFMRGVIDSTDLPLNISREMLQLSPVIAKIRSGVAKRILSDLDKLSREDEPAFSTFWNQFGAVLKEGLYDAHEHRDDLLKVTRFYSTQAERELTSLSGYISRMKEGQDSIYYISGENLETLKNSPQIEGFRARGMEVLFFTDTIDDFWLQSVQDFQGKPFKSVTKGNIDLSRFEPKGSDGRKHNEKEKPSSLSDRLLTIIREELKEDVGDVRVTTRLTDSPVCLIAGDDEVDLRMERVLRIHQKYEGKSSKRVLEINPDHPLVRRLSAMAEEGAQDGVLNDAARLLLDQARIIQGEPVPDPAAFARRMAMFMERALAA